MRFDFPTTTLTKAGCAGLVLAVLIPAISRAIGATGEPLSRAVYEVRGQVRLLQTNPAEPLGDGSGVVVWLSPTPTAQQARLDTQLPHYQMMEYHKMFEPHLLVIPAGSIVEFPNHDPWIHNVFSISRSRRFNLGFYKAGSLRAVKFNRSGVSYLFCTIHPEMMGVVLTVDSTYFGVSDKNGRISIGNVPSGTYFLHVWSEKASPPALQAVRRVVFVGNASRSLPTISIAVSKQISMTGKN